MAKARDQGDGSKPRGKKGGGSVYFRESDARWVAAVTLPSGKRRTRYAPDKDAADELLAAMLAELDLLAAGADRLTVAQWLEIWHRDTIAPNRAWNTVHSFERIIRLHLVPELGHIKLQKLRPADVQALLAAKLRAGCAPASVSGMRICLRAALNQAIRWGYISRNAAALADPIAVPRSDPPSVTPERALALLEAMRDHRYGTLFALVLATGLRHSEALGLRWEDVDLQIGVIRARRQLLIAQHGEARLNPLKKDGRPKVIFLVPFGADALRREKAAQAERRLGAAKWEDRLGLVFTLDSGRPIHRNTTWRAWSRLITRQGLERLTVHDLRHACASLLAAAGVSPRVVADWLGHSDPTTTLNVYTHAFSGAPREAAERLAALLEGVKLQDTLHSVEETGSYQEGSG